jgi:hypothetical protein
LSTFSGEQQVELTGNVSFKPVLIGTASNIDTANEPCSKQANDDLLAD